MINPNGTKRPKVDYFLELRDTIKTIQRIIAEFEGKKDLQALCEDALYFIEEQRPKFFPMCLSHVFRELIEKFFGLADNVGDNEYFIFNPQISEDLLSKLDDASKYKFIGFRDGHKLSISSFIKLSEFKSLLRESTDKNWHDDIWRLNKRFARNLSGRKAQGIKLFYEGLSVKYSISKWSYQKLINKKNTLYEDLSQYTHGSMGQELSKALEKDPQDWSRQEKELITTYISRHADIVEIFRPFELTTSTRIKQIDKLINE